jgi:hypothetical protein
MNKMINELFSKAFGWIFTQGEKIDPVDIWGEELKQDSLTETELRTKIAGEIKASFYPLCICDECVESHQQADLVARIIRSVNKENRK